MPDQRCSRRKPPRKHKANLKTPGNGQTNLNKWLASGNDPAPPVVEEPIELQRSGNAVVGHVALDRMGR